MRRGAATTPAAAQQWHPALPPAVDAAAAEARSAHGCPTGHFARVQIFWGQKAPYCASCPVGKYAPHQGARACEICGPRAFTDTPGSAQCHSCPYGHIANAVRTLCVRSPLAASSRPRTHQPRRAPARVRVISVGGANSTHALARAPYLLNGPTQTQTTSIGECMTLCKQLFACSVGTFIVSPGKRSHQCLLSGNRAKGVRGGKGKSAVSSAFFEAGSADVEDSCGRCQNFEKVHV